MADAGPLALTPDLRVLAFVVGVTVLTGIGFGIAPALRGSRIDVALALNEQGRRGAGGGPRRRVSRTLVMSQIGLSLMLLIGAGLLVRSLYNLRHVDLGFEPEQVVVFHVAHSPRTKDRAAVARTIDELHQRISAIPGVRSASLSTVLLFSGAEWRTRLNIPGYQASADENVVRANRHDLAELLRNGRHDAARGPRHRRRGTRRRRRASRSSTKRWPASISRTGRCWARR